MIAETAFCVHCFAHGACTFHGTLPLKSSHRADSQVEGNWIRLIALASLCYFREAKRVDVIFTQFYKKNENQITEPRPSNVFN
jgi:hypothetical protein